MAKEYGLRVVGRYYDKMVVTDDISDMRIDKIRAVKNGTVIEEYEDLAMQLQSNNVAFVESIVNNLVLTRKRSEKLDATEPYFIKEGSKYILYLPILKDEEYSEVKCAYHIKNNSLITVGIFRKYGLILLGEMVSIDAFLGISQVKYDFQAELEKMKTYSLADCMTTIDMVKSWEEKVRDANTKRSDFIEKVMPSYETVRLAIVQYIKDEFKGLGAYTK